MATRPRNSFVLIAFLFLAGCFSGCGSGGGSGGVESFPPIPFFSGVAVGDLNGDGLADVVSTHTLLNSVPPHPGDAVVYLQNADGSFAQGVRYPAGSDPVQIRIADLNGDGLPDLVTVNAILNANDNVENSTVSVLLQQPTSEGKFLEMKQYPIGRYPASIAVGDLDGDGRNDIAVATADGISVLYQDATGAFGRPVAVSVGGDASGVAIGDVDGDGKSDIVATRATGVVTVVLNRAGFTNAEVLTLTAGAQPMAAAIADLNQDGTPDLAVANNGSSDGTVKSSLTVFLQNRGSPISFQPGISYSTDVRSQDLVIADLNSDGWPDIVVGNVGGLGPSGIVHAGVTVHFQDSSTPGTFLPAIPYTSPNQVIGVAVAAVNRDGLPDLILGEDNGPEIRYQDANRPGTFMDRTLLEK